MDRITIDSKLYIKPTKKRLFLKLLLNLVLVMSSIATITIIIMEEVSINYIGGICLVWLIVSAYNSNYKPGYQFAVLNFVLSDNGIEMIYENVKCGSAIEDVRIVIRLSTIKTIEYSEQLRAIRVVGQVLFQIGMRRQTEEMEDWIIYTGEQSSKIIPLLENKFPIVRMK